jgi:hypothetical protein
MIVNVYAVFDAVAKVFLPPFVQANDGLACRSFVRAVNDRASQLGQFPADFQLYRIGSFDDQTAVLESEVPPHALGSGVHYVQDDGGPVVRDRG